RVKLLRLGHFVSEGLHGQMQHDLVTAAVGFFRDLAGIGAIGEEGKSERVRKSEDGVGNRAIVAEVVENDGEASPLAASCALERRLPADLGLSQAVRQANRASRRSVTGI